MHDDVKKSMLVNIFLLNNYKIQIPIYFFNIQHPIFYIHINVESYSIYRTVWCRENIFFWNELGEEIKVKLHTTTPKKNCIWYTTSIFFFSFKKKILWPQLDLNEFRWTVLIAVLLIFKFMKKQYINIITPWKLSISQC